MNDNIVPFRKKNQPNVPTNSGAIHPPMFNIPPITKALLGFIIAIHAALYLFDKFLMAGLIDTCILYAGFIPASWIGDAPFLWSTVVTPLTYTFLHGSWLHVLINAVMFLTGGAALERWVGAKSMVIIFLASTVAAAFSHFLLAPSALMPVIGASGGISGLFGALLAKIQMEQPSRSKKWGIWPIILLWVGISAIFGFMGSPDGLPVAWIAHIGGFLCGIALVKFIRPTRRRESEPTGAHHISDNPPTTPPTIH